MRKKSGFTIIELVVVISIALIFLGASLVQYNTYTEQIKLRNEGKKLVDVLENVKKKALSADLIVTPFVTPPTFCSNFTGYRITIFPDSYSILFGCSSSYSVVNNYNLVANIKFEAGIGSYDFPPLMNNPNLISNTIRLKNYSINSVNKCIEVSISSIGLVELNETLTGC